MKRLLPTLCVLTLLSITSCICFEKQTLVMKYDAKADRLLIFQLYEGIYAEKSDETLNDDETKQIKSVLEGERTFFFANWILEYTRSVVEAEVEELSSKAEEGEEGSKLSQREVAVLRLARLLLENVTVENGRFFLNEDEKLSGYQMVTVAHASKIVEAANVLISALFLQSSTRDDAKAAGWSDGSIDRWVAAARRGFQWITLDENRIRVRFPLEYADFRMAKANAAESLGQLLSVADSRESKMSRLLRRQQHFFRSDLWISYTGETVEFALGHPNAERARLMDEPFESEYKPNVVPFAKDHGGVAESLNIQAVMDAFFAGE